MDNLGAIVGPLLALGLVALVGVRTAILLAIIPGLLAVAAILYAIRHTPAPKRARAPTDPPAHAAGPAGPLGRLMVGVGAFELGNVAATLLILRATDLLTPGHGIDDAAQIAIALYVAYNAAATVASVPAGRLGDRRGQVRVLAGGVAFFAGLRRVRRDRREHRRPRAGLHARRARDRLRRDGRARRRRQRSRRRICAARRSACSPPCRASATSSPARRRPALDRRVAGRGLRLRRGAHARRPRLARDR